MKTQTHAGFSLIEAVFAIAILSVGALGMAGVFAQGMQKTISSPDEVLATQKTAEAIESVFSARDSHSITWAQINNISKGGVFMDGPQPMTTDGPDGILNTIDDGPVETTVLPGLDQKLGTADDVTQTLSNFTREIKITEVVPPMVDLRAITVTITYTAGTTTKSYSLTALISTFA
jgi:prepilin-type N-terminal cleavage/methylation domain-containing protein